MDGKSLDLPAEKLAQLRDLFPEVFSEGKVDFTRLKDILGENVVFPNEHYELSWAGKAEARKEIQKQTTNTLIADKEASIDFENAQNLFIEGENLEVLRILQKSYFGKVKIIYIDPPYNTGNDSFVYPDDYSERQEEYKKRAGITDEEGYLNKQDLWRKNTRENGQFHSAWLSMMYPRLYLARNLLREDGVIFVSIDDNETNNLKLLMDEVFGEENYKGTIVRATGQTTGQDSGGLGSSFDYVLVYFKRPDLELAGLPLSDEDLERYEEEDERGKYALWQFRKTGYGDRREDRPTMFFPAIAPDGKEVFPIGPTGYESRWRFDPKGYTKLVAENRIVWKKRQKGNSEEWWPYVKTYLEGRTKRPSPLWDDIEGSKKASIDLKDLMGKKVFDNPKPIELLVRLAQIIPESDTDCIILDFFAGSGTTAHAVLKMNEEDGGNRTFICIQMPELLEEKSEAYKAGYRTIADINKSRITKVIEKMQKARAEQLALENKPQVLGFRSFKIAPSNFKNWRGDAEGEELIKQLELLKQSEKDGSLHENMLMELLLKAGLSLTAKVESLKAGKAEAYLVEDGRLFLFFGGYNKSIKELIHEKAPQRVVCLDSAFKGKDEDISNFKLELKEAGIELTIL